MRDGQRTVSRKVLEQFGRLIACDLMSRDEAIYVVVGEVDFPADTSELEAILDRAAVEHEAAMAERIRTCLAKLHPVASAAVFAQWAITENNRHGRLEALPLVAVLEIVGEFVPDMRLPAYCPVCREAGTGPGRHAEAHRTSAPPTAA